MTIISNDYAVFLPAVNSLYAEGLTKELPSDRRRPSGFAISDLEFWQSSSALWHHPHFLHSVGQYSVGKLPDNAVTRRATTEGVLIGDSGGFQIGSGTLKGIPGLQSGLDSSEACNVWREAYEARCWIINWLETYTNYAMTLDLPLWANSESGNSSPFHYCSKQQLTEMTVENLKFIDSHRIGNTNWLNVLQGTDTDTMMNWWEAVKWFNCDGYAFSGRGGRKSGLRTVLVPLLRMRDEKALDTGRDWIHYLGVSTAPWAVMYTAIQRGLRNTTNVKLRVSYDSSSPFQQAAMHEMYNELPAFSEDRASWSIRKISAPQSRLYVGSDKPLPFSSPIADRLCLGDLNVRDGKYCNRQFDTTSLLYLTNHNVWTYLEAFRQANGHVFVTDRKNVPAQYQQCVDVVEQAFVEENWDSFLTKEQQLLDNFKG